jgi:hypothetical protein
MRGEGPLPRQERQGSTQDCGVVKFEVLKEPVSYNHRIYQPGETLEAKDEDMEGFLQAGYVAASDKSKARKSSKK